MTLAVDTTDGRDLSNEVHLELLPKKSNAAFVIHYTAKGVYQVVHY